jgi:hypothetical protein
LIEWRMSWHIVRLGYPGADGDPTDDG